MAELGWFYKEAPWNLEALEVDELLEWLKESRRLARQLGSGAT